MTYEIRYHFIFAAIAYILCLFIYLFSLYSLCKRSNYVNSISEFRSRYSEMEALLKRATIGQPVFSATSNDLYLLIAANFYKYRIILFVFFGIFFGFVYGVD